MTAFFYCIKDFVSMALKKKKINMLTNGKESREFLYADDCSEGLFEIMKLTDIGDFLLLENLIRDFKLLPVPEINTAVLTLL